MQPSWLTPSEGRGDVLQAVSGRAASVAPVRVRPGQDSEQRRACYVASNIAIRRHRVAINDLLFALRKRDVSEGIRGAVRGHFGTLFSMARRLESGDTRDGDSFDAAFAYGERFWSRIEYSRSVMRFDLGIADGDPRSGESSVARERDPRDVGDTRDSAGVAGSR